MSNINNPKNILGVSNLISDEDEEIDFDALEASILNGGNTKKLPTVDYVKEFNKDLEFMGKVNSQPKLQRPGNINILDDDLDDNLDDSGDMLDELVKMSSYLDKKETNKSSYNLDEDRPKVNISGRSVWSPENPRDEQLGRMTNEERKQSHIDKVLGEIDKNNDEADFIDQEYEEDEMAKTIEQIDLLRNALENAGVELNRIPEVNSDTSRREARNILKILQIKNDRLRYCDFFEETIIAGAYGLETVFNGEREIFGSKIDLTGYSDTVKIKLRRMRYDTSNFISTIMDGYRISSGWRIILELIPSLFLYSRDRRLKANDNLISDDTYKKVMQQLI